MCVFIWHENIILWVSRYWLCVYFIADESQNLIEVNILCRSWVEKNFFLCSYYANTLSRWKTLNFRILFLFKVFGIICMACASPAYIGASHWFLFVAVTSFIATLLWSFVYLLGIREVLNLAINWILTVRVFCHKCIVLGTQISVVLIFPKQNNIFKSIERYIQIEATKGNA